MGKVVRYEPCPRCQSQGRDTRGDNLGVYSDGSAHCFANCGYHIFPKLVYPGIIEKQNGNENKAVLPIDFTREIPATAWKWLLQYDLPYSYWKPYTGYSPSHERLVITYTDEAGVIRFSQGRAMSEKEESGKSRRKWRFWGDGHGYVRVLELQAQGPVVVVEDIISNHKVSQVAPSLCLFGTHIHDHAIIALRASKKPVVLWLDADQYSLLPKKIGRLQSLLDVSVGYIHTQKDPKMYSISEIKELVETSQRVQNETG